MSESVAPPSFEDLMVEGVVERCAAELERIDSGKKLPPGSGKEFRRLCKDIARVYDAGLGPQLHHAIHRRAA